MKRLFGKNSNSNQKQQVTPWNPTQEEREFEDGGGGSEEDINTRQMIAPQLQNTFLGNPNGNQNQFSYPSYSEEHCTKDNPKHPSHSNQQQKRQSNNRNFNQNLESKSQPLNHSSSLQNEKTNTASEFPNPYSHSNSVRSEGNYQSRRLAAGGVEVESSQQQQQLQQHHLPINSNSNSHSHSHSHSHSQSQSHPPNSIRPIPPNPSSVVYQDSFQPSQAISSHSHSPSHTSIQPSKEVQSHTHFSTTSRAVSGTRGGGGGANRNSQEEDESLGMIKRWRSLRGTKEREGSNSVGRRPNLQDAIQPTAVNSTATDHRLGRSSVGEWNEDINGQNQNLYSNKGSEISKNNEEVSPYPVYSDLVVPNNNGIQGDNFSSFQNSSPLLKDNHNQKKDPKEGMRKFMAGFGKKDKEKPLIIEREIPISIPNQSLNSSSSQAHLDPEFHSISNSNGKKEAGWLKKEKDKEDKKEKGREMEEQVNATIGRLCANPPTSTFWPHVLSLADLISHSTEASKEAARSLRKEIKYSSNSASKVRAARIWGILSLNASDRFKMLIAEKKFLNVVEESIKSKETSMDVKEMLLKTLGMLAWQFKDDKELSLVTKCWNKIKPSDLPFDGEPLDPYSPDFFPPRKLTEQEAQPVVSQTRNAPRQSFIDASKIISENEDIRKLHEECHIARHNAGVLVDSINNDGLGGSLISEFARKVVLSQEFLVSQIGWATSQADRSRERIEEEEEFQRAQAESEGRPQPESIIISETKEEALMADIFDACEKLAEANSLLEDARKIQREEEEERAVIEKSMVEVRVDRSTLAQDPVTGDYYALETGQSSLAAPIDDNARASSSRPPSPAPPQTSFQAGSSTSQSTLTMSQFSHNNPYLPLSSGNQSSTSPLMSSNNLSFNGSDDRNPYNRLRATETIDVAADQAGHRRSFSGQGGPQLSNPISSAPGRASPSLLAQKGGPRPLPINTIPSTITPIATRPSSNSIGQSEGIKNGFEVQQDLVSSPPSSRGPGTPKLKDDDGDSIILTPTQPSEKALGKRRAFSDRGDAFDPRIQTFALGDQLQNQQNQPQPTIQESKLPSPLLPSTNLSNPNSNLNSNVDLNSEAHLKELRSRPPPQPPISNQNQNQNQHDQFFTSSPQPIYQPSVDLERNSKNPFLV